MRRLDLSRYVVNQDYSTWPIDFAMSASFEVPADRAQAVLPPRMHVLEARPGVALLNLSVFNFTAETHGLTAACAEVVASLHVMPNLAIAPELPRLSLYTIRLAASTREFIESRFATDHYPVYPDPVHVHIDRAAIAVEVVDAEGRKILTLAAARGVTPRYEDDRFYVQSSTAAGSHVYVAGNLFAFTRAQNQQHLATAGAPHQHPFYDPLDVSDLTPRQCHMQMWTAPGTVGYEHHFFLQPRP